MTRKQLRRERQRRATDENGTTDRVKARETARFFARLFRDHVTKPPKTATHYRAK
jgi:hypothetical protein